MSTRRQAADGTGLPQLIGQLAEQPGSPVLLDLSRGGLVDARRAVIRAHHGPRAPQNVTAADLVIQRMESPPGIGLWPPGTAHAARHGPDQPGHPGPIPKRARLARPAQGPSLTSCASAKQRPFPPCRYCCPVRSTGTTAAAAGFASCYGSHCRPPLQGFDAGPSRPVFRPSRQPATGLLAASRTGLPPASDDTKIHHGTTSR
jgi:hypothetical protein